MNYGELIQLGRHKLMCGDATRREDVMRLVEGERVNLVLTDPPYGVNIARSGSNLKHHKDIIGDSSTVSAKEHYDIAKSITNNLIIWGAHYFTEFLPPSKCWLVWDKHHSPKNYADGELAYTSYQRPLKIYHHRWNGMIREGKKYLNPSPSIHPTQKPVELHMRILEDFTQPGDIILDCFGGSGTTLIACEMTGRKCLMMEISPDYCDIIKSRYDNLPPSLERSDNLCP